MVHWIDIASTTSWVSSSKSAGDMTEMIRDCGYFAFCAIKTSVAGKDKTLKKNRVIFFYENVLSSFRKAFFLSERYIQNRRFLS